MKTATIFALSISAASMSTHAAWSQETVRMGAEDPTPRTILSTTTVKWLGDDAGLF